MWQLCDFAGRHTPGRGEGVVWLKSYSGNIIKTIVVVGEYNVK